MDLISTDLALGAPQLADSPVKLVGAGDIPTMLANAKRAFEHLPVEIMDLAHLFAAAGQELSLVGGPVRDAFLGVIPHDFDLTTSAHPDETEKILKQWANKIWDVGRNFGTIGARKGNLLVEVTTYRTEEYDPESRKPQVQYGDSLEGDLSRRDFTVNAIAMQLPNLKLVDPYNGLDDLARGILRTPASATQSFNDDPLRMMRAARFAAQLAIDVDIQVIGAMRKLADRLSIVSAERIQAEFSRLMTAIFPRRGLELMVYTGIVDRVIPEIAKLVEAVDEHGRHKDVYEHTLIVLDQAIALETNKDGPCPRPDLVLRLAALFHDIGKPATRKFEPGGKVSFHHHEVVGAKMARKRMRDLKYDKATTEAVTSLVFGHLRFHGYGEASWTDSAVRRYATDAGDQLERLHRLTRADVTTRNQRKANFLTAAYDDLEYRLAQLRRQEELDAIRPDLDGHQIMQILGLKEGREVGQAYKFLMQIRMEEGPLGVEAATQRLLNWWKERQN